MRWRDAVPDVATDSRQKLIERESKRDATHQLAVNHCGKLSVAHLILVEVDSTSMTIQHRQILRPRHRLVPPQQEPEVVLTHRLVEGESGCLVAQSIGAKS